MKNITVKNRITEKEHIYTQLTSIEDINSYIDEDIEFAETMDVISDIIKQRGVTYQKRDEVDCLSDMHKFVNKELKKQSITFKFGDIGDITINGFNENTLPTKREPILEMKREGMIKLFKKYGEIWVNKVGGYCTPLNDYEIIN